MAGVTDPFSGTSLLRAACYRMEMRNPQTVVAVWGPHLRFGRDFRLGLFRVSPKGVPYRYHGVKGFTKFPRHPPFRNRNLRRGPKKRKERANHPTDAPQVHTIFTPPRVPVPGWRVECGRMGRGCKAKLAGGLPTSGDRVGKSGRLDPPRSRGRRRGSKSGAGIAARPCS